MGACISRPASPQCPFMSTQASGTAPGKGATVRHCGIIGYPLDHSVSPAFQQAAFDALGIAVRYERWPTPPEALAPRILSLSNERMIGANVTVPYKERVAPLMDQVDPLAARIGAINTIVNRSGHLSGYNTDAPGFLRSLTDNGAFQANGARALVLGAGGAARAIVFALTQAGAAMVVISNRTPARAEELMAAVPGQPATSVTTLPWGQALPDADLIVNTTTMGMRGGPAEGQSPLAAPLIPRGSLVCDLVYNPQETPLLAAALMAGARPLGGLPMLVYQGAIAFELWTGRTPPIDLMFAAAREALG